MFNLIEEDYYAILIAQKTARLLLKQPAITPKQIIGIGNALYAFERLPEVTSGVNCEFGISHRAGDHEFSEMQYITFRITDYDFEIAEGGSVYNSDVGSDTIPATSYSFELSGARQTDLSLIYLEDSIQECLNLGGKIGVDDESDIDYE